MRNKRNTIPEAPKGASIGRKSQFMYGCKSCGRVTSTTNEYIFKNKVCFQCRERFFAKSVQSKKHIKKGEPNVR